MNHPHVKLWPVTRDMTHSLLWPVLFLFVTCRRLTPKQESAQKADRRKKLSRCSRRESNPRASDHWPVRRSTTELYQRPDTRFGIRFTPLVPQWYVKDAGHSTQSAGGRRQLGNLAGKRLHTQLVRERSSTDVSARWANADWSLPPPLPAPSPYPPSYTPSTPGHTHPQPHTLPPQEWNWRVRADVHLKI